MPTLSTRKDAGQQLREALAPYLDLRTLRSLAATDGSLEAAVRQAASGDLPRELRLVLDVLRIMLRPPRRERISSPADVAALLMVELSLLEQEVFCAVMLNTKNQILGMETIYRGTIDTAPIRVAEVFKGALRQNAAALILAHNHPSGDPTPSPEDARVTTELVQAGTLLGVTVLDHLVIGRGRWVSLRERGLGGFDQQNSRRS